MYSSDNKNIFRKGLEQLVECILQDFQAKNKDTRLSKLLNLENTTNFGTNNLAKKKNFGTNNREKPKQKLRVEFSNTFYFYL